MSKLKEVLSSCINAVVAVLSTGLILVAPIGAPKVKTAVCCCNKGEMV